MMNFTDIISVDPGQKTLGSLHPEITDTILRNSVLGVKNESTHSYGLLGVFFAAATPGSRRYGLCILLLRMLFATIVIVAGSFILYGEISAPAIPLAPQVYAIALIVIGSMLAVGFLSRIATLTGFAGFAYIAVSAIFMGVFNISALMLCMGSLAFLMLGTGRYSLDFFIRKSIHNRSVNRRRKIAERRLTYQAYRYASLN